MPPFTPYNYQQFLTGIHFTRNRYFPIEYILAVLQLDIPYELQEDTPIEEIIKFYEEKGVNYDKIHSKCYQRFGNSHLEISNFHPDDFEGVIIGKKYYKFTSDDPDKDEGDLTETNEDIRAIIEKDKLALQNYGRPYKNGKPTGSYYKYPKKIVQNSLELW